MSQIIQNVDVEAIKSAAETMTDPGVGLQDKLALLAIVVKLLASTVNLLSQDLETMEEDHHQLAQAVAETARSIVWICYNPGCGTPNEESCLTWPLRATRVGCRACGHVQPWAHLKQFGDWIHD